MILLLSVIVTTLTTFLKLMKTHPLEMLIGDRKRRILIKCEKKILKKCEK